MKRPSIHDIVYNKQFPKPKQNDPPTFYYHMQRNLVPEVRVEVQTYYGALESLEAQYPGLDYTYEPHRRRLARFPWHRRLFRVFDELKLTNEEILSICQWEGTKSAKDKYEAETGRRIRDTTIDGITIIHPSPPCAVVHFRALRESSPETMIHVENVRDNEQTGTGVDHSDEDDLASVGVQLHDQLMAVAEGDASHEGPLEEWLKYMSERDDDRDTMMQAIRAGQRPPTLPENFRYTRRNRSTSNTHRLPPIRSVTTMSQHSYPTQDEMIAQFDEGVQA